MEKQTGEFQTVGDLVEHLARLGLDRPLIVDNDGSIYPAAMSEFYLWNENDEESPVAIDIQSMKGWK